MTMKFTKKFSFLILLLAVNTFIQTLQAQVTGDYRYKANTTGNWSTLANWEKFDGTAGGTWSNATGWAASPELPTTTATTRVVGSSNVTVDANTSVGSLDVYGTLTVSSSMTLTLSGALTIAGASKTSVNDGTITFAANAFNLNATNTFNNTGIITQSGALNLDGTLTNTGTITKTGGNFNINGTGIFNNNGSGSVTKTGGILTIASGGVFNNAASFTNNQSGTNFICNSGSVLNNTGTITRTLGTFTFGGTYKGTGTYAGNIFTNTGIVAPGNSTGTLSFGNAYTNGTATLNIEINGASDFDKLMVTGNATAGGTLNVTFGFTPTVGQTFQIISATGTNTGSFATINSTPAHTLTYSAGVITVQTVLPIELSKFDAKAQQKSTLLTWTTASEKDNASFAIQHSTNGTDFSTISEMKGQGTSNVATAYNYQHSTPSVGINYYRLAQVDLNGTTTYSPIRSVEVGKKGSFAIKTNLVQNNLVVISSDNEETQLSIVNTSGQLVLTTKVQGEQAIDVSSLSSGLYFVHTATGIIERFVKQ